MASLQSGSQRLRVDFKTSDNSRVGLAVLYLHSGDIAPSQGVKVSIACLLTPLAVAKQGASPSEIEEAIRLSRVQFETYMNLARAECLSLDAPGVRISEPSNVNLFQEVAFSDSSPRTLGQSNGQGSFDDDDILLDLENEVL